MAVAALLLQDVAGTAAQIGSEPIYLWHLCRSGSTVNTHIESSTTHLLWQKNAASVARYERTLSYEVVIKVWTLNVQEKSPKWNKIVKTGTVL